MPKSPEIRNSPGQFRYWPVLSLALCLAALSPFIGNGYYFDDGTHHAILSARLAREGTTYLQYFLDLVRSWAATGRVFPVRLLVSSIPHYLVTDLKTLRFLHVASVGLNVLLLAWILMKISRRTGLAIFVSIFIFGFFQFRNYHSAVASYAFLMQVSVSLRLLSQYLFWEYLNTGKRAQLATSVCLFALALLDYEPAVLGLLVYVGIVLIRARTTIPRREADWFALLPFAASLGAYLVLVALLRIKAENGYLGVQVGNLSAVWRTYWIQFSGAFPLSNYYFRGWEEVPVRAVLARLASGPIPVLIMVGATSLCLFAIYRASSEKPEENRPVLLLLFLSRILLAPVMVAMSAKYQLELRPGLAYLPVYSAVFGLAPLLSLWTLDFLRARASVMPKRAFAALAVSVAVGCGLLVAVTYAINQEQVNLSDRYWKLPRSTLERALAAGIMENIPENARVLTDRDFLWLNSDLIYMHAGCDISLEKVGTGQSPQLADLVGRDLSAEPVYFLTFSNVPGKTRWAAVSKLVRIIPPSDGFYSSRFLAQDVRIYVRPRDGTGSTHSVQTLSYPELPRLKAVLSQRSVAELPIVPVRSRIPPDEDGRIHAIPGTTLDMIALTVD